MPDSVVSKFLLANGYLGMMSIHLCSRSINKKCFILNRKLNEMLLLDFIIYVIRVKQEEIFQFGESEGSQGSSPDYISEQAKMHVTYLSVLGSVTCAMGRRIILVLKGILLRLP